MKMKQQREHRQDKEDKESRIRNSFGPPPLRGSWNRRETRFSGFAGPAPLLFLTGLQDLHDFQDFFWMAATRLEKLRMSCFAGACARISRIGMGCLGLVPPPPRGGGGTRQWQ